MIEEGFNQLNAILEAIKKSSQQQQTQGAGTGTGPEGSSAPQSVGSNPFSVKDFLKDFLSFSRKKKFLSLQRAARANCWWTDSGAARCACR